MRSISFFATMAVLASFSAAGHAAQVAYATNYHNDLFMVDTTSSGSVMVGTIGFAAQGLAATSSGRLYATNNAGKLFDVTGAVVTPIANLGALDVGSLDSTGSTLWGYDNGSKRLFEYDPISTTFVQWSSVLAIPADVEAIAINPAGDFYFIATGPTISSDKFGKITNGSWAVSLINPAMGLADHCEAMDFTANGKLYAMVLGDTRYEIDPVTGAPISGFFSGVHRDWADMTAPVSVPEPATVVGFACGIAVLVRRRRSRR